MHIRFVGGWGKERDINKKNAWKTRITVIEPSFLATKWRTYTHVTHVWLYTWLYMINIHTAKTMFTYAYCVGAWQILDTLQHRSRKVMSVPCCKGVFKFAQRAGWGDNVTTLPKVPQKMPEIKPMNPKVYPDDPRSTKRNARSVKSARAPAPRKLDSQIACDRAKRLEWESFSNKWGPKKQRAAWASHQVIIPRPREAAPLGDGACVHWGLRILLIGPCLFCGVSSTGKSEKLDGGIDIYSISIY